jgi:O-methyltransferase domain/Dimerisation domain
MSDSSSTPVAADATAQAAHAQVMQMAVGHVIARIMYVLAELAVADHLEQGPRSADEIARATGAHAPSVYRLLRCAAGLGFFVEDADRCFRLTPLGAALQSDAPGRARSMLRWLAGPVGWRALSESLHSVKTGQAAMEKAFGQSIFDYLAGAPKDATLFNEMMIAFHGNEPPAVAAAYDFSAVGKLVDVGGGTGNLLTTILRANPKLRGVLYDVPHVAAEARGLVAERGLLDRCEIVEGSFFESVPTGGDAYLMSHIIHDWDEASCLRLLGNCRRAMADHGRVLLVEMVIPPGNEFHPSKLLDVVMLTLTPGGRERTEADYGALFEKAGLKLTRAVPTASPVSVIEAKPV